MVRGLRWLRAEQSFDGGVDVSSRGDERLQVGLSVDEAHRAQLFQLLLETHLRSLGLSDERQNGYDKKKKTCLFTDIIVSNGTKDRMGATQNRNG